MAATAPAPRWPRPGRRLDRHPLRGSAVAARRQQRYHDPGASRSRSAAGYEREGCRGCHLSSGVEPGARPTGAQARLLAGQRRTCAARLAARGRGSVRAA